MAGLPINFAVPGEGNIASYSWTDIAEGTGIVRFLGTRASVDATPANDIRFLTEKIIPCSDISSEILTGTPSATVFNFDVTFNSPKVVSGKCIIVTPAFITSTGAVTPKITVIKWDGSSETTLVSQIALEAKSGTAAVAEWTTVITVPLTKFKKGETFRIKYNFDSTTSSFTNYLRHDTSGGSTSFTKTGGVLSVYVPFRIDL